MSKKKEALNLFLYPEPGSNRHGLPHWFLRPARLPIPPSGQELNVVSSNNGRQSYVFFLDFQQKKIYIFRLEKRIVFSFNFAGIKLFKQFKIRYICLH